MAAPHYHPTGIVLLRLLRFQLWNQWRFICTGRMETAIETNERIAVTVEALEDGPPPQSEQAEDLLNECNRLNDQILAVFREEKELLFGELFRVRVERQIDRFLQEKSIH